jgi:hypothetical protein
LNSEVIAPMIIIAAATHLEEHAAEPETHR